MTIKIKKIYWSMCHQKSSHEPREAHLVLTGSSDLCRFLARGIGQLGSETSKGKVVRFKSKTA